MIDDLDHILAASEVITPSPGFVHSVMRAIRGGYSPTYAIRFPWFRFVIGLIGSILCILAGYAIFSGESSLVPRILELAPFTETVSLAGLDEVFKAAIILVGSLLVVRLSFELISE